MSANSIDNSGHITPGDDGVHQPVGATVRKVFITEAETAEVIHIVGQGEVSGGMHSRDLSRFACIGFDYHRLLDRQESIFTQDLTGARGMFRRDEIRMRPTGSLRR